MAHGESVNSIEVEAPKLFDRMARRFHVDYMAQKNGGHAFLRFLRFSGFLNSLGCGFYHDKLFFIHRI